MIIRLTRLLIVVQLAFGIGIYLLATKVWRMEGVLAVVMAAAIIFVLRTLVIANNFYLASRYHEQNQPKLNWREWCRVFLIELGASLWTTTWAMPFKTFSQHPSKHAQGLPVLLIHGYGCNSGYWQSMSQALSHASISHYALDLEPILANIDHFVAPVHEKIEAICHKTGHDQVILVAHSMGGLVARAYLRDHGPARIAKLITLGTPHRGTGLATFGIGANSKQMRLASDWLHEMKQAEGDALRQRLISIYSHHDNIVAPQDSSIVPGALNIAFNGIGHVRLGFDLAVQARVIDEILRTPTNGK